MPQPLSTGETFHIVPLNAALGAEVIGLDASRQASAEQILALKQALKDHHILLLRDQQLEDQQFIEFAAHFGPTFQPPRDIPVLSSNADGSAPDIVKVANTEDGELGNFSLPAHIDHQWTPQPSAGSLLYALQVPSEGGDTTWTNLALAYASLDGATRAEIDSLRLINYNPFVRLQQGYSGKNLRTYRTPDIEPVQGTEHPLVRTHPDSGKRLLYLSANTEVEIPGYDPERGQALIARLREHLANPRFSYQHKWRAGDIIYWDNQATLHARTGFPADQVRRMKRISLGGSRPF